MQKLFPFLLLLCSSAVAQSTLDSLQNEFNKTKNDSLKAEILYQIAREQFSACDYEASIKSAQQSAELFKSLTYYGRQAWALQ